MGDVHYMISETAKRVGVESHVLRYWEEELELPIGRTDMGHRYYTEENIQLFSCIRELKDQGMQLREIKEIIPDMLRTKELLKSRQYKRESDCSVVVDKNISPAVVPCKGEVISAHPDMEEIKFLFGSVMQDMLLENNKILEEHIYKEVTEKVAKDMDFLLQAKERQEEDRFRKLDHLIRQQQNLRKAEARHTPGRYLRKLLGEP